METTLSSWVTGDDMVHYSPGGLAWAQDWGSLRMTANAAFLAVVYAKEVARALPPPAPAPSRGCSNAARSQRLGMLCEYVCVQSSCLAGNMHTTTVKAVLAQGTCAATLIASCQFQASCKAAS